MSQTLTLSLQKPGSEAPQRLQLSLTKGGVFTAEVSWDCDPRHRDDLDVHALACANDGAGAKVNALERVISTYNTTLMNPRGGVLPTNPDGSFSALDGAVNHSGDMRIQKNTERIVVDTSKLPPDVNEIPLFATVHKAEHGAGHEEGEAGEEEAAFADVDVCTITMKDEAGRVLGAYQLSDEFGEFNVVQLGSIMLSEDGMWEYAPVGSGFTGDFNDVLAVFS